MKRIITLAIMALLIGGFTVSANAQTGKPNSTPKSTQSSSSGNTGKPSSKPTGKAKQTQQSTSQTTNGERPTIDGNDFLSTMQNSNGNNGGSSSQGSNTNAPFTSTINYYPKTKAFLKSENDCFSVFRLREKWGVEMTKKYINDAEKAREEARREIAPIIEDDCLLVNDFKKASKQLDDIRQEFNAIIQNAENSLKGFEQAVNDGCQLYSKIKQRNNGNAMSKPDQMAINKKIQLAKKSKNSVSVSALDNSQKARYDKASKNLDSLINKFEHAKKS